VNLIALAFTERNAELVRHGLKHATTRRDQHGEPGDVFELAGERYRLMAVIRTSLGEAAQSFFFLEGENTPAQFYYRWSQCYGLRTHDCNPYSRVFVHIFLPDRPSSYGSGRAA
jgi:hypothetical protein